MIVLVCLSLLGSASSFAPVHHRFIGARIALNDAANGDFANGDSKALLFGKLFILVPSVPVKGIIVLIEMLTIQPVEEGNSINLKVSEYYGKTLSTSDDLLTNACCTSAAPPEYIQQAIERVSPTVRAKYYGCGLCLPQYDMTVSVSLDSFSWMKKEL